MLRHRPIGIGVQGLANIFYQLNVPLNLRSKMVNDKI